MKEDTSKLLGKEESIVLAPDVEGKHDELQIALVPKRLSKVEEIELSPSEHDHEGDDSKDKEKMRPLLTKLDSIDSNDSPMTEMANLFELLPKVRLQELFSVCISSIDKWF